MKDNQIRLFISPQFGQIRTTVDENGEPLFVAADICTALGYAKPRNAVQQHVDEGDALKQGILTASGNQQMTVINESGLYALIFGSTLPQAKAFKKWVTSEVLPAIRKMGSYNTPAKLPTNKELAMMVIKAEEEKEQLMLDNQRKDKQIATLQPKADFADAAFSSDTLISFSQAAKILKLGFGRNTLFKKLREKGVFFKSKNEPQQRFVDAKYFHLIEGRPITRSDGSIMIPVTPYCTQKGLAYINHLFGSKRTAPQLAIVGGNGTEL